MLWFRPLLLTPVCVFVTVKIEVSSEIEECVGRSSPLTELSQSMSGTRHFRQSTKAVEPVRARIGGASVFQVRR